MAFCFTLPALSNYKISKKDKYFVKCFFKKVISATNKNESKLNFGVLFEFWGFFLGFWNMVFVKTAEALDINAVTKNEAFV